MMNSRILALFLTATVTSFAQSFAPGNAPEYIPGEVLVQFNPAASDAELLDAVQEGGLVVQRAIHTLPMKARGEPGLNVAKVSRPVGQVIRALTGHPGVHVVEPNWVYQPSITANDPRLSELWGLRGGFGANAESAWLADSIGSSLVEVGIIDTGVDISHPDLANNMWQNPEETPGNGVDDDGNGYVDDVFGWDFERGNNSVYDGKQDDHGTHVAGTIGAVGGNATGVVGVNWRVSMIVAKFLGRRGGSTADAIEAIDYLTALKRNRTAPNLVAINASWGGGGYSSLLEQAIARAGAEDILFVAASGNGDFLGRAMNTDAAPHYPSSYTTPNIVSVTAIASNGTKASWANYGVTSVDLGAPGVSILSTLPGNKYGSYSGTSMATPHVTGAVALYASENPWAGAGAIKSALFATVTPTPSLQSMTATGGRLDVSGLLGIDTSTPGNLAPEALDDAATAEVGQTVGINVLGNDSDPDGDDTSLTIVSVDDIGTAGTVTFTGSMVSYTAPSSVPGDSTDTFTYTIRDLDGATATAEVTVTVTDPGTSNPPSGGVIDMSASSSVVTQAKGRNLKGTATVRVYETDNSSAGVSDAVVFATWLLDGFAPLEVTGTTGADGAVTFVVNAKGGTGEFRFTVDDVQKDGYNYVP